MFLNLNRNQFGAYDFNDSGLCIRYWFINKQIITISHHLSSVILKLIKI